MDHCGYIYQACNFLYTGKTLDMPPDMEGVTRAKKDSKTRKYHLLNGVGNCPTKLTTYAENKKKAIKYVEARWKDCNEERRYWLSCIEKQKKK